MSIFTYDRKDSKKHWVETELQKIIENAEYGDTLETISPLCLACSTSQILEIFNVAINKGLKIKFENQGSLYNGMPNVDLLKLLSYTENQFVSRRTTEALARRKAKGLPLGRPKGRKNKELKLDQYKTEILNYLAKGISKSSIAKLVDCHPQTLFDWLKRSGINHG